ncbi:HAMP domain-containing histidine kinase [Paenibacillus sp. WQ 127069]|uniref:histidine kinase n=1 Tax=Paenibacillus baimaensis TaxID=2982185 RepID=A0ABT2UEU0_9BACL|nr:HAMP domain-containing sensor histidine kinase [Paenibacillus sp. WQ 127069]MCU6792521.1 HAMP domain-containing histidine kinase [Paenibacillus sp. WQ 127069]
MIVDPGLKLEARFYADHTGDQIELSRLFKSKGWLEELDEDRRVLRVHGEKQDRIVQYSEDALYRNLENLSDQDFYYSVAILNSNADEARYLLLKIQRDFIRITTNDDLMGSTFQVPVYYYLGSVIGLNLLLIFVYSYWVARRLKKPLKQISQGLDRMTKGHYDTRISLDAEKEFIQIRDTFNYMADVIETTLAEKRHAEESKQRLIVDLSHDLKTPITSIQGYAQALYEGRVEDSERQKKYLSYIYHKSIQVTKLIHNMMDLLKVDSPDYLLRLGRSDAGEFLREIVADVYEDIEQKQFQLKLYIPDEPVYAVFDPELLTSVVQNLITNSITYNPPGTYLRIELKSAKTEVQIEIADNGIGIPAELWSTIFDPFVRGDEARSGEGGTGLGLSIAKRNTEKMGGSLELRENGEEATLFIIRLRNEL